MPPSGVKGGVDRIGDFRNGFTGSSLGHATGVRAVHGTWRTLNIADGAVIVSPHVVFVRV